MTSFFLFGAVFCAVLGIRGVTGGSLWIQGRHARAMFFRRVQFDDSELEPRDLRGPQARWLGVVA
jgi:hypothetical protein